MTDFNRDDWIMNYISWMAKDLNPRPHSLTVLDNESLWCETCKRTWTNGPQSLCPGIPVFPGLWENVWPEGLMTKTQLNQAGYSTGKKLPPPAALLHWSKSPQGDGYLRLYDPAEATPKRQMTEAQKAALAKAQEVSHRNRHCNRCDAPVTYGNEYCDRCDAVFWSKSLLKTEFIILDSETTGLWNAEIVAISVIDQNGSVLLDSLLKPQRPSDLIEPGDRGIAPVDIHGIHPEDVENAPDFGDVYPQLVEIMTGKHVVVYNAEFDLPLLNLECERRNLETIPWKRSHCAMLWFAQWFGDWSYRHRNYRWQRLPGGDHTALGDCKATLRVLKTMADDDWEKHFTVREWV